MSVFYELNCLFLFSALFGAPVVGLGVAIFKQPGGRK